MGIRIRPENLTERRTVGLTKLRLRSKEHPTSYKVTTVVLGGKKVYRYSIRVTA